MKKTWMAAALACLCISPAWADPPPASAPPYRPGVSLQPVAIYDAQGNVVGLSTGGSVTAAGTNGTAAQAVQGINGGVPVAIQGGNAVAVRMDGSAVTQPVSAVSLPLPSGAATSAAQTTGNASLSSIDGKMPAPVSGRTPVDGSGVTQPVSAVSLPLPSGAATAARQAAPGVLGSPSAEVLSIQLPDTRASGTLAVSSTANVLTIAVPHGAATMSFAITGVTASGATLALASSADGVNFASGSICSRGGLCAPATGITADTTNARYISTSALQAVQLQVTAAGAGTVTIVYNFSVAPAPNATSLNTSAAGAGINLTQYVPSSSAGTNVFTVKASAGRLYKITGKNTVASDRFLKCMDKATAGVPGTDTPKWRRVLPASATFSYDWMDIGASFSLGLTCWITTSPADADTTAIAAGDIVALELDYQ